MRRGIRLPNAMSEHLEELAHLEHIGDATQYAEHMHSLIPNCTLLENFSSAEVRLLAHCAQERVLLDRGVEALEQHSGRAGLGQEAKDVAAVHRVHGAADAGLAGQDDARGIGRDRRSAAEEDGAAHAGHAKVTYDRRKRAVVLECPECLFSCNSGDDLVFEAEDTEQTVEDVQFVIEAQDPCATDAVHSQVLRCWR